MHKAALNSLDIPVVIWEQKDHLECTYTNIQHIYQGMRLEEHIDTNNIFYKDNYTSLIDTGEEQKIICDSETVVLKRLDTTTYSEIHYPKCEDMYILYSISNKIRTPLNNIVGIMDLVDSFQLTEKERRYMNIVKKSSYNIVGIANDIVDIVNLENNKVKLNRAKYKLKDIILSAHKVVADDIDKRKLKFSYKIATSIPETIMVDKNRLTQVIVSLLNNSIKNTSIGSINIEVTMFNKTDTHNCPFEYIDTPNNILFKVRDTGNGMDDNKRQIVDRILKLKSGTTTAYKKMGFGLLISRYLVNLMGGNLWYKSELDIGSVFYFNTVS